MADKQDQAFKREEAADPPGRDLDRAKRDFAQAIAKAELGRFYFGEAAERALRQALRKKPPKRRAG